MYVLCYKQCTALFFFSSHLFRFFFYNKPVSINVRYIFNVNFQLFKSKLNSLAPVDLDSIHSSFSPFTSVAFFKINFSLGAHLLIRFTFQLYFFIIQIQNHQLIHMVVYFQPNWQNFKPTKKSAYNVYTKTTDCKRNGGEISSLFFFSENSCLLFIFRCSLTTESSKTKKL